MESIQAGKESYLVKLHTIRNFIFDMDGTLTDGSLFIMPGDDPLHPNWIRKMNAKDGYALHHAIKKGYNIAVVSGGDAIPVEQRMRKLGTPHVFFNVIDKELFIKKYFEQQKWSFKETLYMGDDIPDIDSMKLCAIASCPADSADEVIAVSNYISPFRGGEGCARDVIRMVMKVQGKW